jgi:riboflavin transporter
VTRSPRLDTTSLAGVAVFSALGIVLAGVSQALGLNFPLIPYLQFDVGEVAIVLAFFFFGPLPALVSSFVEFGGLMVFGQAVPVGPLLKLFALTSTVAGLWLGSRLASRRGGLGRLVGLSGLAGAAVRAAVMTVPNYYLVVYLYGLGFIEGYLQAPFMLLGIRLGGGDALVLILAFTAVFNVVQLSLVMVVSYLVLRFPAASRLRVGGRLPWFASALGRGEARLQAEPI